MAQPFDAGIQCHGKKRPAESEPQDQPLAKRLGRLHIGKAFVPLQMCVILTPLLSICFILFFSLLHSHFN